MNYLCVFHDSDVWPSGGDVHLGIDDLLKVVMRHSYVCYDMRHSYVCYDMRHSYVCYDSRQYTYECLMIHMCAMTLFSGVCAMTRHSYVCYDSFLYVPCMTRWIWQGDGEMNRLANSI